MEKVQETMTKPSGLQDQIAADSSICFIDGPNCRLVYRGYSIDDLAKNTSFEEVVYLLLKKKLPNAAELKEFSADFRGNMAVNPDLLSRMSTIPKTVHPMAVLRTMVSALSFFDPDTENTAFESNFSRAVHTIAQTTTLVAAWDRVRNGKTPIAPNPKLSVAANFLYMLNGQEPDELFVKAVDLYLVLLADHELNASTFACRVTASTLSDYYSAVTSAIGALKGPLHGGANEQVIKMLLEIGDESKAESYVQNAFETKQKIMGFGHRVYKVQDPRSVLLKEMALQVCQKVGKEALVKMSEKIEAMVTPVKKLPANVDFYSASLLYCVGVAPDLFTPMFVMSRIAGYSAHYLEQFYDNRLIRPRANYVGDMDLKVVPIQQR